MYSWVNIKIIQNNKISKKKKRKKLSTVGPRAGVHILHDRERVFFLLYIVNLTWESLPGGLGNNRVVKKEWKLKVEIWCSGDGDGSVGGGGGGDGGGGGGAAAAVTMTQTS